MKASARVINDPNVSLLVWSWKFGKFEIIKAFDGLKFDWYLCWNYK